MSPSPERSAPNRRGPLRFSLRPTRASSWHLRVRGRLSLPSHCSRGASDARNDLLFDDILRALEEGRSPLVLTERRDHLEYLAGRLRPFTRHLLVMHGGTGTKARREVVRRLAEIPPDEERLVLATGRYVGEGFDDARFDTLFLAMPFAWRGTLVQYAGRLQREYTGKKDVHVYDYVDRAIPVLRTDVRKAASRIPCYGVPDRSARIGIATAPRPKVIARSVMAYPAWPVVDSCSPIQRQGGVCGAGISEGLAQGGGGSASA